MRVRDGSSRPSEDRIAAVAIVNQAALKCILLGVPVTPDNIVHLIGDFYDPTAPSTASLTEEILHSVNEIAEVVAVPRQ